MQNSFGRAGVIAIIFSVFIVLVPHANIITNPFKYLYYSVFKGDLIIPDRHRWKLLENQARVENEDCTDDEYDALKESSIKILNEILKINGFTASKAEPYTLNFEDGKWELSRTSIQ